MAVTVQVVLNNTRNVALNIYVTGANTDAAILDVAATDPALTLVEAQWSLTGGSAVLEWDATTDDVLLDLCAGNGFFLLDPGIMNPRSTGVTNDVFLTNGIGVTNGSIYLKFKKT